MKHKKEEVSLKAKICTVISGTIVLGIGIFSVYAGMPSCAIESIDHPLWGLLMILIAFSALAILFWGYKSDNSNK